MKKKNWEDMSRGERVGGLIGVFAVLIVIIFLAIKAITSSSTDSSSDDNSQNQLTSESENTQETEQEKTNPDIAQRVEEELKLQLGINEFSDGLTDPERDPNSPYWYISSLEKVSDDTVRIFVQTTYTDEESKDAGKSIFGLVGKQLEQLKFIVIRDTSGIDVNVQRSEVPILNL